MKIFRSDNSIIKKDFSKMGGHDWNVAKKIIIGDKIYKVCLIDGSVKLSRNDVESKISSLALKIRDFFGFTDMSCLESLINKNIQGHALTYAYGRWQTQEDIAAITTIQKYIRRDRVIGQKAHEVANVLCLQDPNQKDPDKKVVGYRMLPGSIDGTEGHYPYVGIPPEVPEEERVEGFYKKLTHRNGDFVVLTLKENTEGEDQTKIQADAVVDVIEKHTFKCLVPQRRINKTQFMCRNLGGNDLNDMAIIKNQYNFNCADALLLAQELDEFHAQGFAHRDIKPGNMFFDANTGKIYLTDFGLAGKISAFDRWAGTGGYMPKEFTTSKTSRNINALRSTDKKTPINTIKQDQFCLIASLMILHNRDSFSTIHKEVHEMRDPEEMKRCVEHFASSLPCSLEKKNNLIEFMLNPVGHYLACPLVDYLSEEGAIVL
jgi:serine/threonine protein kinase